MQLQYPKSEKIQKSTNSDLRIIIKNLQFQWWVFHFDFGSFLLKNGQLCRKHANVWFLSKVCKTFII